MNWLLPMPARQDRGAHSDLRTAAPLRLLRCDTQPSLPPTSHGGPRFDGVIGHAGADNRVDPCNTAVICSRPTLQQGHKFRKSCAMGGIQYVLDTHFIWGLLKTTHRGAGRGDTADVVGF